MKFGHGAYFKKKDSTLTEGEPYFDIKPAFYLLYYNK